MPLIRCIIDSYLMTVLVDIYFTSEVEGNVLSSFSASFFPHIFFLSYTRIFSKTYVEKTSQIISIFNVIAIK